MYVIIKLMPCFKKRAGRSAPKFLYYTIFLRFCQEIFEKNFVQIFPKIFVQNGENKIWQIIQKILKKYYVFLLDFLKQV